MEEKFSQETLNKMAAALGIEGEIVTNEQKQELAEKLAVLFLALEKTK
jgi:hypothetical protein